MELYRGALNKLRFSLSLSFSCFPFYRTSRGCRTRGSGEMAESAQIRGELSAGFPRIPAKYPRVSYSSGSGCESRGRSEIASAQENCESFAFRLHRESRDITGIHLLVEGKGSLPINSVYLMSGQTFNFIWINVTFARFERVDIRLCVKVRTNEVYHEKNLRYFNSFSIKHKLS